MGSHCPGQDRRYWTPEDIALICCPVCGEEIELFKDEGKRNCPVCGILVRNPRVLEGCASWCGFAEECIGLGDANPEGEAVSAQVPVEELIIAIKKTFHPDRKQTLELYRAADSVSKDSPGREELPEGFSPLEKKVAAVLLRIRSFGLRDKFRREEVTRRVFDALRVSGIAERNILRVENYLMRPDPKDPPAR